MGLVTRKFLLDGAFLQPPDMEDSYEYIQQAVADRPQGVGPPAWGLGEGLTNSQLKKIAYYEMLKISSDSDGIFGKI
jgi:hypothetical protein